jgi:hypothetical protein
MKENKTSANTGDYRFWQNTRDQKWSHFDDMSIIRLEIENQYAFGMKTASNGRQTNSVIESNSFCRHTLLNSNT